MKIYYSLQHDALLRVLDLGAWSLDLAAWIFAGYSSKGVDDKVAFSDYVLAREGKVVRIVDNELIAHGTIEFREAQKEHDRILELLTEQVNSITGSKYTREFNSDGDLVINSIKRNDHFDRNFLINLVTNVIPADKNVRPWWIGNAIADHLIPAYIDPDELSPGILEARGYNSYIYPFKPDKVIDPPDVETTYEVIDGTKLKVETRFFDSRPGDLKGEAVTTTVPPNQNETIRVLYKRGKVRPKGKFYSLLFKKIDDLRTVVPEIQYGGLFGPEGWGKHCSPRPTQSEALKIAEEIKDKNWKVWVTVEKPKDKPFVETLHWEEQNVPKGERHEYGRTTVNALGTRVDQWFERTGAGHQYMEHIIRLKKTKYKYKDTLLRKK